jgi:hypothetical protein
MKTNIALINTMNQIGTDSIGTVISLHRTPEAALQASLKFQQRVKRANGQNSYIPTQIVRLKAQYGVGVHVHPVNAEVVEEVIY